ncbi:MAG: hypothetical protein K2W82_18910 [Candidatus Obscuribacterales bacterium]|nr:hypothetical protein [Candidatus Obscuribacterales bacterium]
MASIKTLEQALKDILHDDGKISKYDAKAVKELILADGKISNEEVLFLERALLDNVFDSQAHEMLSRLLLREELKYS